MTVADLLNLLQEEELDRKVILAIDPEGNDFNDLGDMQAMYQDAHGDVFDVADTENEDDDIKPVLVLWPRIKKYN